MKGKCLPIATWLRYRSWPLLVRREAEPTIETSTSRPNSAPTLLIPLVNTSVLFRFVFIAVLLGAIGLSVVGQYRLVQTVGVSQMGWALLAGGVGLFVLADYLYRKQIFKDWSKAKATYLRLMPFRLISVGAGLIGMWGVRVLAGDGWIMRTNPLIVLGVWCVALGLVVAGCYRADKKESYELSSELGGDWSRQEQITVLLLFIFAYLVRSLSNGTIPWCFFNDEGSTGLTALEILHGNLNNLFGIGWYGFPAFFFVVPAAFIAIGGPTIEAVRTPSALAGALTVVGLYWMARPLFGRWVAGLSAGMLAAMHYHIHFSRVGINNIWDGFFAVYVLGLFWRGWLTGRRWHFIGAGLLLGMSQYFYGSSKLLPVMLLAVLAHALFSDRHRLKQRLPDLLAMGALAVAVFLPLALYYVDHPDVFLDPMKRVSSLESWGLEGTLTQMRETGSVGGVLSRYFSDAALAFTSVPFRGWWYVPGTPMLLSFSAALFYLGLTATACRLRHARYLVLLVWLAGVVAMAAVTDVVPAAQRYVLTAPAVALLVGIALGVCGEWLAGLWPRGRSVVYTAAGVVMAVIMAINVNFYFWDYVPHRSEGPIYNAVVATNLGRHLQSYPEGAHVYFFVSPYMHWAGFPELTYLAPQAVGQDIKDVLTAPPDWPLDSRHTVFVFVPERQAEEAFIEQRYPGGASRWVYGQQGQPIFLLYELDTP